MIFFFVIPADSHKPSEKQKNKWLGGRTETRETAKDKERDHGSRLLGRRGTQVSTVHGRRERALRRSAGNVRFRSGDAGGTEITTRSKGIRGTIKRFART